jgi:hypothetical protein
MSDRHPHIDVVVAASLDQLESVLISFSTAQCLHEEEVTAYAGLRVP